MSSLYGDLPPPSTDAAATDSSKSENAAGGASATISKPPLPAGWSASLNRLKPIPRRTQLPKPKQAQRSIPAGFVQHSETTAPAASTASPVTKSSTSPDATNANTNPTSNASSNTTSGGNSGTSIPPVSEETNWLKAKMVQVQNQKKEREENMKKQFRPQARGPTNGPPSLDDDYDLSRPNEFEEVKQMLENERAQWLEERSRQQTRGRSYSRSRSRSRSWTPSYRSRSRSRSYSRSRSRSRSPSRSRSRSPRSRPRPYSRSRSRGRRSYSRSRSHSRSPSHRGYGAHEQSPRRGRSPSPGRPSFRNTGPAYSGSKSRSRSRSRGRGRSPSPLFGERRGYGRSPRRHLGSHSRSPSGRRRSYSRSRSRSRSHSPSASHRGLGAAQHIPSKRPHSSDQSPTSAGNPTKYRAFAPPPSLSEKSLARVDVAESIPVRPPIHPPASESPAGVPSTGPSTAARIVLSDASGEDAYLRRMQMSQHRASAASYSQTPAHPPPPPPPAPAPVPASPQTSNAPASRPPAPPQEATSRVILLTNMVGPGEVDDMLQDETAGECEKYGRVIRCLIFEVQKNRVPPEEAVRIFVKFESPAAADRALRDLNGRFFGGRQVRGQYFDEQRFDRFQLAP